MMNRVLTLFFAMPFLLGSNLFADSSKVRAPAVAGSFYPADKRELARQIDGFLAKVPAEKDPGDFFSLILPHAGITYSGQVAAYGYKLIANKEYETVILIGPSHRIPFEGVSIWKEGIWKTPLGDVEVDSELAKKIAAENPKLQFSNKPHLSEHSLEVELPFLQRSLKHFKIVPILLGDISLESSRLLADAIAKNLGAKKVLILASSDMSHYFPAKTAESMDRLALELIEKGNPEELYAALANGKSELCGAGAVLTVLELSKIFGGGKIHVLKYAHSGDVTGDRSQVVGYGASVLLRGKNSKNESESQLGQNQKKELLKIARRTIENKIMGKPNSPVAISDPALQEKRAAFVTIKKNGELRGCIGNILPVEPLSLAVKENAMAAATMDLRFPPLHPDELKNMELEISVLSLPEKITDTNKIELGKHGVILTENGHSGVFLPQVASETGWSREQFLGELCSQKAGLPAGCWRDKAAEIFVFSAQVFSEKDR